jgi:hypothetical protein
MIEKSCKCGTLKKNFKFDIGTNFVAECCLENGYTEIGELVSDVEARNAAIAEEARKLTVMNPRVVKKTIKKPV